jgi:hypothetical protein
MKINNRNYTLIDDISDMGLRIPDTCPMCHHGINPDFIIGYHFENLMYKNYRIMYACPRKDCLEVFFASYSKNSLDIYDRTSPDFRGCSPYKPEVEVFDEAIEKMSSNFVKIYNQAKIAEERHLDQICGLGYRKALEFLIKDYLISKFPQDGEAIKSNHKLDAVINKYVSDEKVKFLAKRAAWLGNDQAHYTQVWQNKDITDLKRLIKTALYWIGAEKELEYYSDEMTD